MPYTSEAYEQLFTVEGKLTESGTAYEILRHKDVYRYRRKTYKSGNVLECELYPLWQTRAEARKARKAVTREAQKNLNDKNARKRFARLCNANFTEADICQTLTYKGKVPDEQQARRDIQNYLRRIREYRRKHNLPPLKYVYVIEYDDGTGKRKTRIHHHIIMSGMDREVAEKLWAHGWANARRLQPDDYGLEAIARYMIKQHRGGGEKRWAASKNLIQPKPTVADTKLSKRQAERLAEDVEKAAKVIFEKHFPGYRLNDCQVLRSDFVAGAYIYVRMHKDRVHSPPKKTCKPKKKKVRQEDANDAH